MAQKCSSHLSQEACPGLLVAGTNKSVGSAAMGLSVPGKMKDSMAEGWGEIQMV